MESPTTPEQCTGDRETKRDRREKSLWHRAVASSDEVEGKGIDSTNGIRLLSFTSKQEWKQTLCEVPAYRLPSTLFPSVTTSPSSLCRF